MRLVSILPKAYPALQRAYASAPKAMGGGNALPPIRLAFVITHRCNLRCAWCMVTHPDTRKTWNAAQELSPLEIEHVTQQTPRYCMITITGGEPFVRPDLMEILDRVSRRRPTHLVTNATLITDEQITWLVDHGAGSLWGHGLATVGVSVEGPSDIHNRLVGVQGSYEKTMSFIARLISLRASRGKDLPLVDVKIVLSKDNWAALPEFRRQLQELGVDLVTVQIQNNQVSAYGIPNDTHSAHALLPPPVPEIPTDDLRVTLETLTREGAKSPGKIRFTPSIPLDSIIAHYAGRLTPSCLDCHATWTTAHIGPYGDLFPCFSYSMGNIRNESLSAVWNGEAYRKFRRSLKKAAAFPGCVGCCMASPRKGKECGR